MARFTGKSIIVTGAGSGIGRATAHAFAAEGGAVLLADQNAEAGEAVAEAIRSAGGTAAFQRTDVSDSEQVRAMVARAVELHGGLHAAFNNAGVDIHGPGLADWDEALFDKLIAINLKGCFLSMKHEIPALLASGGGAIVNTASIGAVVGRAGLSPYCSAKHGVLGMTRVAALDYAAQGIRINAILPGATNTPMIADWMGKPEVRDSILREVPMHRVADPAEIAQSVLFLASEAASFMTGQPLIVDGGQTAA